MTGQRIVAEPDLAHLREQALDLVAGLPGPLRRLRLTGGGATLEIEWPKPAQAAAAERSTDVTNTMPGGVPTQPSEDGAAGPTRVYVLAPMVGVFYQAPEPTAAPFVQVGDLVEPGQVIGIVEAMKLMNQITAEHGGRVAEILVGDGDPVEFAQPLIALVPD
jgi:acetyl-CoA carboxylase biotin carboxyl carrier protein